MPKTFLLDHFVLIFSLILASCGGRVQISTIVPPSPSISVTPSLLDTFPGTATPTFLPVTPEPTVTPLFRAKRISAPEYGQNLTLFVGDKFILSRLPGDDNPLTIDNQQVLQAISNRSSLSVTLQAVGIGKARVSSLIVIPCPNAPIGCQPPQDFTYVNVTVVDH